MLFRYKVAKNETFRETTFRQRDVWALKLFSRSTFAVAGCLRRLSTAKKYEIGLEKIMDIMWLRIYCSRYSFFMFHFSFAGFLGRKPASENKKL